MKKLTDLQLENIIEDTIQKKRKNKINSLVEYYSKKWNNCSTKKERFEFFNELYKRRNNLINEGYSSVTIDENIIGDLFRKGGGGFLSTFKEWLSKKIIGKIASMISSNPDPDLINALSIGFANLDWTRDWTKLISPVKNCEYISDVMVDSVIEYYVDKKVDKMFGDSVFGDSMRNAIMDALNDQKNVQSLQNVITNIICKAIRSVFGKTSVTDVIKSLSSGKTPSIS